MRTQTHRSPAIISQLLLITAMLGLAACSGTRLAYDTAETLDAKAYVLAEHFNALQVEANTIADAGASQSVINRMAAIERRARPVVLRLQSVAQAYAATRSAENEQQLQLALNEAALVLSDFINAVRGT